MFLRQLILLFPLFFIACSNSDNHTDDLQITDYNYSTAYDISQEATKKHRMLVIRLDYANQHFVNNESSWAAKIFGTQNQQLNHYMNEVSNGKFQYTPVAEGGGANDGVVTVYFTSEHPDPDILSLTFESTLHPNLEDAINAVSNYGFDFSLYDDDQNGKITSGELLIVFIMAGEEDAYSGGSSVNGVWAHQYCTEPQYTPNVNGVYVMGCDQDGNYAIFGERHHDTINISHAATIGIIAHELGHAALGLIDLYDVTYNSAGIGYFGLMSSGTWGQANSQEYPGQTPVPFSAWSKTFTGWVPPIEIRDAIGSTVSLQGTGYADYNIIKVPISDSEYFLLENRSTTGYDKGLTYPLNGTYMGGVAIWHIDEDVISSKFDANIVNNNVSHKGVDLEEADKAELDYLDCSFSECWTNPGHAENLYYSGNIIEFSHATSPDSDSYYLTEPTGIIIDNISSVGSTMTVDIINPN